MRVLVLDEGCVLRYRWAAETSWDIITAGLLMQTCVLMVLVSEVCGDHYRSEEGNVSEMSKSASEDGRRQEHGTALCVDNSDSVLCDASCY